MTGPSYLVWSNQRGLWWKPGRHGYTHVIDLAGRYSRTEAEEIVRLATLDGKLTRHGIYDFTGLPYTCLDEVMVLAPESIPESSS